MLEGKEIEVKVGEYGTASVDVTPDFYLDAAVVIRIDIIKELRRLAEKTGIKLAESAIDQIELMVRTEKQIASSKSEA